jgi:WD40 repeat protein
MDKARAGQPIPMLDTGGHTAIIRDIAFTPDGRQIVSASDDKTIRVWDVASGKTVRTIRGEAALVHLAGSPDSGHASAM